MKTGYGKSVDWYTVGAAFYEFLVGVPPFYSEDLEQLHYNIQQGPIQLPRALSDDSKDLIIRLMYRNPTMRLGANGSEEIKSHPFFNGVDWQKLKLKTDLGEFDNEKAGYPMPERSKIKIRKKMKQDALNALDEINEDVNVERKKQEVVEMKDWEYRS